MVYKYTLIDDYNEFTVVDEDGETLDGYDLLHLVKELSKKLPAYVYLAEGIKSGVGSGWTHKIGKAVDSERRMKQLQFEQLHELECTRGDVFNYEWMIQGYFTELGRWIKGEYFALTEEDVALFYSYDTAQEFCADNPPQLDWVSSRSLAQPHRLNRYYKKMREGGYATMLEAYRNDEKENKAFFDQLLNRSGKAS